MNLQYRISILTLFFGAGLLIAPAYAHTQSVDGEIVELDSTAVVDLIPEEIVEVLEEAEFPTTVFPNEEMTRAGLFFLDIRERVALFTAFNPVTRAERAVRFAEERTRIAEILSERVDTDSQVYDRIELMLERSEELTRRAEMQRERVLERVGERSERVLERLLIVREQRERVLSSLEESVPAERLERVRMMREDAENQSMALLNALENQRIPERVQTHLEVVKERIEAHRTSMQEFREVQQEILERVREGDAAAREELRVLQDERREDVRDRTDMIRGTNLDQSVDSQFQAQVRPMPQEVRPAPLPPRESVSPGQIPSREADFDREIHSGQVETR